MRFAGVIAFQKEIKKKRRASQRTKMRPSDILGSPLFSYPFRDSTSSAHMYILEPLRSLLYMCPHTTKTPNPQRAAAEPTIYVYYKDAQSTHMPLELLFMCPHTADYLRKGCYICVLVLPVTSGKTKHICRHSTTCVLILLHTCPNTTNQLITLGMDAQSTR
jgi:hypothetical protein